MFTPAALLTGDRGSADQARALRGVQETLARHPRARIYARLARMRRPGVLGNGMPNEPPDGLAAVARRDVRVPATDQR